MKLYRYKDSSKTITKNTKKDKMISVIYDIFNK